MRVVRLLLLMNNVAVQYVGIQVVLYWNKRRVDGRILQKHESDVLLGLSITQAVVTQTR